MKKINKSNPPKKFSDWVKSKPRNKNDNEWFQELYKAQKWDIISELIDSESKEQFYLCCYCCDYISGDSSDTMNEHIAPRAKVPTKSLDYSNIVASCKTRNQCDDAHKDQILDLTPLMDECETEFKFKISGRVEGLTSRAVDAIQILKLGDNEKNNRSLIEKRKQICAGLLWANSINPSEGLEDEELLEIFTSDVMQPKNGKLEPFAPVVVNILKNWLK